MAVSGAAPHNNSVRFTATYQWDTEGRMTSLAYPTVNSPNLVNAQSPGQAIMPTAGLQYDANGRLNELTMDAHDGNGPQWLANATYTAAGQLYQLSHWGWTETRTYNALGQLTNQSVPSTMNMTYNYSATANNGRITGSVDAITGENTSYTYDALNRLTNASNSLWSRSYTFDGFGNLTSKSGSGAPSMSATYDANNHRAASLTTPMGIS